VAAQLLPRRPPFLTRLLTDDPDLRERVEAAERLGISLRRFEGWEPTTAYEHQDGRLVTSTPEVEWDDTEQGWMLALAAYRRGLCPGCGGELAETAKPEHEDRYRHRPPVECHRCVGFTRGREAFQDHPHPEALIHRVPRIPRG
jgi:hypothetical protein